jgi:hypothetical protein
MMRVCFTDRFLACRALDLVRRNRFRLSRATFWRRLEAVG